MLLLEGLASGTSFVVLSLLLGTFMITAFVLPRNTPVPFRRETLFTGRVLILVFLLVSVLALVVQGTKLQRGGLPSLDLLGRYLFRTWSGKVWLFSEGYVLVLFFGTLVFARGEASGGGIRLLFLLATPLVMSRSLIGHAAAMKENMVLAILADALHFLTVGLWAGGLPILFWALHRGPKHLASPLPWMAETVNRFSGIARFSVAILLLTGLYQSWLHVESLRALTGTPYGQALLIKHFLFLLMVGLGALNLLSTKPGLERAARATGVTGDALRQKVLRRIGAESVLGLLVLLTTGFLTALPPAHGPRPSHHR